MLQTEYVRSMNCNYERILLEEKPDEKRYQYCILTRGGIKGLLSCSLRYINGLAYLYYDISSRQNVAQLYSNRCIGREWIQDFAWSLKQIQQELGRFLLDTGNILWHPEQIFQDLESNIFSFLYVPYYKEEAGFMKLIEFWVEHIDYDDEVLVDFIYRMYEQMAQNGEIYLQLHFFEDIKCLEKAKHKEPEATVLADGEAMKSDGNAKETKDEMGVAASDLIMSNIGAPKYMMPNTMEADNPEVADKTPNLAKSEKRGILGIFEGRKQRGKKLREDYKVSMQQAMDGYAVAEETIYNEEEYGRTMYVEQEAETRKLLHRLFTPEGKMLACMEQSFLSIGKKKEEVDLALEDASVSRLHARIIIEKGNAYLEDLNSTNGTFKNGLRLQPYEKRKLEEEDEIKCGKVVLIFR